MALIAAVERETTGDPDDAEIDMRVYAQMDTTKKIIVPLETYLTKKKDMISFYESILGEKLEEMKKLKYVLKGLSTKNFGQWPLSQILKIKAGQTLNTKKIMEELREIEKNRYKEDDEEIKSQGDWPMNRGRGLSARVVDTRKCFNCNEIGHIGRDCKKPSDKACSNCKKPGHHAGVCQEERTEPSCYHCGQKGHLSRQCLNRCEKHGCDWTNCKAAETSKTDEKQNKWGKLMMARSTEVKESVSEGTSVPIDNGASFSAFNKLKWFEEGSMVDAKGTGLSSITGDLMAAEGCGTVKFEVSDGEGNWKEVRIENVAYMPMFEAPVISETQFRWIEGQDIIRPEKRSNGELPMIMRIDGRAVEILPDITDNLYYVDIKPLSKKDGKDEHQELTDLEMEEKKAVTIPKRKIGEGTDHEISGICTLGRSDMNIGSWARVIAKAHGIDNGRRHGIENGRRMGEHHTPMGVVGG
jgi:hypothetical protein